MEINLNYDQSKAYNHIIDFYDSKKDLLTLGGYAGTGKTTLMGNVASALKAKGAKLAFCTLSGKASTVLKSKLYGILDENDYCGTIHGLIYMLIGIDKIKLGNDEIKQELHFQKSEVMLDFDFIIIDEASMIDYKIYNDLASHGIPILAVGDHGQLPPIRGSFNLMEEPDIVLEKIMRQAENNPIIQMSIHAREEGNIPYGDYENGCIKTRDRSIIKKHNFQSPDSIVLCAMNRTRVGINDFARNYLNSSTPIAGEPLICLYNNRRLRIFNGMIGVLEDCQIFDDTYNVRINMGEFLYYGSISRNQFGKKYMIEKEEGIDLFDYGYCITTHKSQGSEWENVTLYEERMPSMSEDNWRRWLYTSVTRAKERLVIIK